MVRKKENNGYSLITDISSKEVRIAGKHSWTYKKFKDMFTWQDGHPCGVEEGGEE